MKHILLISTGGTIACTESTHGLTPAINAEKLLTYIPEIKLICSLTAISIMNIDSTNMTPERMGKIAEAIQHHFHEYDGFVITHGTDTMAYTSAALSCMMQNLSKPVILTGSQIAMELPGTDATKNLSDAIRFACEELSGVYIAFDGILIDGLHAMKVKTKSLDAFKSMNYPVVAEIRNCVITYFIDQKSSNQNNMQLFVSTNLCTDVMVLKLFPGMKIVIFDFIKKHYKGIIIESFGIGGVPGDILGTDANTNSSMNLISKVHQLATAGISVVITTQCLYEGIDLGIYEVGQNLANEYIISAPPLPTEALTMKLMWALGNHSDLKDIKDYMEKS